jgi:hypothetical protein
MKWYSCTAAVAILFAIAACDSAAGASRAPTLSEAQRDSIRADSIASARQDSINRAQPGYVIDSVLPVEEEMRRFREKVGGSAAPAFAHASPSRDALVRRIVADVANSDSVDLFRTLVSPREFVDLIYPSSPYTRPPLRQSPEISWMLIANPSTSGFKRLVGRLGGTRYELAGYTCEQTERQGDNQFWNKCTLRLTDAEGNTSAQRWFGSIVERGGKFKVMSFTNQF